MDSLRRHSSRSNYLLINLSQNVFSIYTPSTSCENPLRECCILHPTSRQGKRTHAHWLCPRLNQRPKFRFANNGLKRCSCKRIFDDKLSGSRRDRPGLECALDLLREGDTLVVWKLDRLGRSVKDLVELVGELEKRGVHFRSLTDAIDTSTPAGHFLFHVMASLAQMEQELLMERRQAGLEAAKAAGRVGGRKPKMTPSKLKAARQLLDSGVPPKDVAANLGISVPTLYRWIPAHPKESLQRTNPL